MEPLGQKKKSGLLSNFKLIFKKIYIPKQLPRIKMILLQKGFLL